MNARGIPPEDNELPDQVERDPAALSSAEDLDEDRLAADPLESGMDPTERWAAADRHGMTAGEQAEDRPLDERLAEERPDDDRDAALDERVRSEAEARGQSADEAGGSMASSYRTPRRAD
ncbi:hypothetical protein [Pseudonocardia acaciae]|uniref:hypothetical protein n=1 Tax=Pseudonocardia acaciae TaxID=551276 RepID=UPI00048C632F|nr:hypothetical protein [Pseudonocardia acaciae]